MRIIGIDPGYAIVGYGVIDYIGNKFKIVEYGAITTESNQNMNERFKSIHDDLNTIIERTKPEFLAIEELFFNSNQKTAINVAQARGVLLLSALNHGISVHEYTPLQVKTSSGWIWQSRKKASAIIGKINSWTGKSAETG